MDWKQNDWIDQVVRVASRVGCNPVRTRWKLIGLKNQLCSNLELLRVRMRHARYEHQQCPSCGAVLDHSERSCSGCGAKLDPRLLQVANRLSAKIGVGYSNTFLLGSLFLLCFWRSCLGPHGFDLNLASNGLALLNSGGNVSYASIDGEWWRLLTCVFLHGGLIHLLFNMAALKQIGPEIESVFGRGRMLFFFVMTGIIASFGSSLDGSPAVRIGASGAIMGMIGVAGGWGQRLGSRHGLSVRNQMLRWAMYTIIYGYALGADNVAHAVGLMAGVVIGFLSPAQPERVRQTVGDWLITACATILIFGAVAIILVRPACLSPMWSHDILSDYEDGNDEQSVF